MVVGIIGAVIAQKGWSYYAANKSEFGGKLNINSKSIVEVAKKSMAAAKRMAAPGKVVVKERKTSPKPEKKAAGESPKDGFTNNNVFKRLGELADPYDKGEEDGMTSKKEESTETTKDADNVDERQKSVTNRQINLISDLLED
ncbi:MAG: hypothetical protein GXP32_10120 [Kiritimatiellaeota bacterium]|nr:hypothetical protein [Kiritimatiellota bacterium]